MKTKSTLPLLSLALGLTFSLPTGSALAQGTAFTYQGMLNDGGNPANGSYDLRLTVYDALTGGAQQGNVITTTATAVSNGRFTVTLDPGSGVFDGSARWLEIAVRTNGGGAFTTLTPRQTITPTPYAIQAGQVQAAGVMGTLSSAQLGGTYSGAVTFDNAGNAFSGNGSGLTGVNAATVGGVSGANLWKLNGNSGVGSGQFLGTTDNQPLEFRVNGQRALRLEPGVSGWPNVIGGAANTVAAGVYGASIGGGGGNTIQAGAHRSTIGGGVDNTIQTNAYESTIGGGVDNTIQAYAYDSTVGGGYQNTIQSNAYASTIGGGWKNTIQTNAWSSTIGGGVDNTIQTGVYRSTIGGGIGNTIQNGAYNSTIGGGYNNTIQANATRSTIGGGSQNSVGGDYAAIPGGYDNAANGAYSFAAGRQAHANHNGAFVWADSQDADFSSTGTNQFAVRAQGGMRLDDSTSLFFGARVRQMLNLWSTDFGIGVQDANIYFRVGPNAGYAWYQGGQHQDGHFNSGGGTQLMRLESSGSLYTLGAVNPPSDRNLKENFRAVDAQEVLAKVAALPLTRWNYKASPGEEHIGPVAQDFHAAFGLGTDDKHIATVDADGVALAAIQGLNRKLETEATTLRAENAELKARLERLERLLIVTQMPNDE